MAILMIGGVEMPEPKQGGLTYQKEKIWSKNTGRVATGDMAGDVVARKWTLEIEWPPLTGTQAKLVDDAIDPAFITVKFRNPFTDEMTEQTMYAGTPTYPVYSFVRGYPRIVGTKVKLIQQ